MNNEVTVIIQARMTSTRLPGKVLMDIAGQPALAYQIGRVRKVKDIGPLIVATTTNSTDDPMVDLCRTLDVDVYRGDEADVLGRYRDAADHAGADHIMRLTADCPMIDPGVIGDVLKKYAESKWDYVSNCNPHTFPNGLDVEVFGRGALEEANRNANHSFLREHVTPYIRASHKQYGFGEFRRGLVECFADLRHIRWPLDTPADLERIRKLVSALPPNYTWQQALSLATKRPELLGVDE